VTLPCFLGTAIRIEHMGRFFGAAVTIFLPLYGDDYAIRFGFEARVHPRRGIAVLVDVFAVLVALLVDKHISASRLALCRRAQRRPRAVLGQAS